MISKLSPPANYRQICAAACSDIVHQKEFLKF